MLRFPHKQQNEECCLNFAEGQWDYLFLLCCLLLANFGQGADEKNLLGPDFLMFFFGLCIQCRLRSTVDRTLKQNGRILHLTPKATFWNAKCRRGILSACNSVHTSSSVPNASRTNLHVIGVGCRTAALSCFGHFQQESRT